MAALFTGIFLSLMLMVQLYQFCGTYSISTWSHLIFIWPFISENKKTTKQQGGFFLSVWCFDEEDMWHMRNVNMRFRQMYTMSQNASWFNVTYLQTLSPSPQGFSATASLRPVCITTAVATSMMPTSSYCRELWKWSLGRRRAAGSRSAWEAWRPDTWQEVIV